VLILDEFIVHTVKLNENSVLASLEEMRRSVCGSRPRRRWTRWDR
jgi:hypothetical protein